MVCDILIAARTRLGRSQRDIAKILDVAVGLVSMWETGTRELSRYSLAKVLYGYGLNEEEKRMIVLLCKRQKKPRQMTKPKKENVLKRLLALSPQDREWVLNSLS